MNDRIAQAAPHRCVNSERRSVASVVEYLTCTEKLVQRGVKNEAFQPVLILVTDNTLLKLAFGLKLLDLMAFLNGKPRPRYSSTHVQLMFHHLAYQGFSLRDET